MDPNDVIRVIHKAKHGHLERRYCTAEAPMPLTDKDKYMWGHPDAVVLAPYFNLVLYQCPHCQLTFKALPPEE